MTTSLPARRSFDCPSSERQLQTAQCDLGDVTRRCEAPNWDLGIVPQHEKGHDLRERMTKGKATPLSVIVLNWNGKHFLRECFDSLRSQTFRDFQTILVDNGSTDSSLDYVRQEFPEVRVIALNHNAGFAGGNNVGIQASTGEYVALLNNDTKAHRQWLESLKTTLDAHPEVGFCASKILLYDQPDIIDSAGDLFYTCGVGEKRGRSQKDDERFAKSIPVFGACAAAVLYRREMLEDIGLFDEDFFAYAEDVDLSFRAQLAGHKCLFVPQAVVYHHLQGTSRSLPDESLYLSRRNAFCALVKNMPAALLWRRLPYVLGYYFAVDLAYIGKGKVRPILKARLANIRRLRRTLAKRRQIQAGRRVSDEYINGAMSTGRVRQMVGRWLRGLGHRQ
jgi:GT2 family glycosyltransferase